MPTKPITLPLVVALLSVAACAPAGGPIGPSRQLPDDGGLPLADSGIPDPPRHEELCNGYDDDLDGEVDETCTCEPGESQACFPGSEAHAGVGACTLGMQRCAGTSEFSRWGPCEGAVGPGPDECGDGIDSDCDGIDPRCDGRSVVDTYVYGEDASTRPVDIVWAIDQSGSMGDEIDDVQRNINTFASTIASSGLDYRVVMVAARTRDPDDHEVCVPPPLANPGCADAERFMQIDQHVDSHDALVQIQRHIETIERFMRPGSLRVFIVVSDDESSVSAVVADGFLRSRVGYDDYVFDAIVGVDEDRCRDVANEGRQYMALAAMTGGIVADLCERDWGLTFGRFADHIITRSVVFALSEPPVPGSVRVFYLPAPGTEIEQPEGTAWHYDAASNSIVLHDGHTPADGTTIQIRYDAAS